SSTGSRSAWWASPSTSSGVYVLAPPTTAIFRPIGPNPTGPRDDAGPRRSGELRGGARRATRGDAGGRGERGGSPRRSGRARRGRPLPPHHRLDRHGRLLPHV